MQSLGKILIPRQLFLLLVLSTGLLNHVILIPNLLTAAGRDSWLSVIVAYPIALVFLWLIYYIIKNSPSEGFFFMVQNRLGNMFSYFLRAPVFLFLFISAYVTFRDLMIWLSAYFLAEAPIIMINIVLILVCCIVTLSGVKTMAIASGLLLPIVVLLGFFIALTNTSFKDPSLLFPVLTDGYIPLFRGTIYVLAGLLELYIVVLLQPFSQEPITLKQLLILLTVLTGLIFGPLSATIMEFGVIESVNFRYPAYEQWRVLNIGEYISNLDFFALYQWLSGALIRIGLFMYLLGHSLSRKKREYRLNPKLVGVMYLLLLGVALIKVESFTFYQIIYLYVFPVTLAFFLIQILLSAFIIFVLKKRDKQHEKENKLGSSST
ncbi:spore germination protein [Robertmurraya korlensis]|uniref:GerAB/ArcD/ProY family transporter n=1 Tax=Robertmurraya korlensis TaxID=519977 RepID=UPI00203B13C2|nr:endospore germination permease [Robertmurraya korlensis]MCM3601832.1 spore germination protein [Robertmurraya korlensis]